MCLNHKATRMPCLLFLNHCADYNEIKISCITLMHIHLHTTQERHLTAIRSDSGCHVRLSVHKTWHSVDSTSSLAFGLTEMQCLIIHSRPFRKMVS